MEGTGMSLPFSVAPSLQNSSDRPCFGLCHVVSPEDSEHREPGWEPVTGAAVVSPSLCLFPEHPPALVTQLRQRSYF